MVAVEAGGCRMIRLVVIVGDDGGCRDWWCSVVVDGGSLDWWWSVAIDGG